MESVYQIILVLLENMGDDDNLITDLSYIFHVYLHNLTEKILDQHHQG
jgi:hypothetical protein